MALAPPSGSMNYSRHMKITSKLFLPFSLFLLLPFSLNFSLFSKRLKSNPLFPTHYISDVLSLGVWHHL